MTFCDLTIYNDTPLLIRLCTELDLLPNLCGFHRTFATGVACRQGTLTPPDTWFCPIWDLQKCSLVETTDTQSYITPVYDTFPWFDLLPTLTLLLNIGFQRYLQRVWHADRGRLLLRTPGPVPLGLAYVLLVETNPFPNLSLFYRTILFEYPSVLSRFYLNISTDLLSVICWLGG